MSITSGFYNSSNGDRRINAEQMSAIFDGIINDGIFASVGTAFAVEADIGNTIKIGVGRAWFNSTWIYNDSPLYLTAEDSEVLQDRYDAVVIDVDRTESVRWADIKIIKGTPSTSPTYPTLNNTTLHHQYPLAYILRKANSTEIKQTNITNAIGTSAAPYVTGILQVQNIDNIVAQWMAEWEEWFEGIKDSMGDEPITNLLNRIINIENGTTTVGEADKATKDGNGNVITNTYAGKTHKHTKSEITDFPATMPPRSHQHFAHDIMQGILGDLVVADPSSVIDLSTKQIRNIYAGTSDMTPGTTYLDTGDIYVMYE